MELAKSLYIYYFRVPLGDGDSHQNPVFSPPLRPEADNQRITSTDPHI